MYMHMPIRIERRIYMLTHICTHTHTHTNTYTYIYTYQKIYPALHPRATTATIGGVVYIAPQGRLAKFHRLLCVAVYCNVLQLVCCSQSAAVCCSCR